MPNTVPLEVFATVSARIASGQPRARALAEAAIDGALFDAAQAFWLGRMADEARAGRSGLAQRYGQLYAAAQAALAVPRKPEGRVWRMAAPGQVALAMPRDGAPEPRGASSTGPQQPGAGASAGGPAAPRGGPAMLGAALPPYKPRLTVEQFAAFRADLVLADDVDHPVVWERFGLDAASWPREDAYWQAAFAGDRDLFQRYLRQFQYCKALMAPRG
jgi:hypothetical protein